jgi:UDP-N-acetylglucosamine 1-carboxyvinyltransferase
VGIVTENLFAGRFRYVEELVRMGADIRTDATTRWCGAWSGCGRPGAGHDIRAGGGTGGGRARADGETTVSDAHHIDRGYDDLVGKLQQPGGRHHPHRT